MALCSSSIVRLGRLFSSMLVKGVSLLIPCLMYHIASHLHRKMATPTAQLLAGPGVPRQPGQDARLHRQQLQRDKR